MTPEETIRKARLATSQGFGLSAAVVLDLITAGEQLVVERDLAVDRLESGVLDLARARGVHASVIRVALGVPDKSGTLCTTEQGARIVRREPA